MLFKLKATDNREGCSKSPGNKHLRIGNKIPEKFLKLSVKKTQGRALSTLKSGSWRLKAKMTLSHV